ncbi:unnamed protein product [Schistosoma mattheei]|uniref:Uncharacterized protein n=1 Tax=Schistosoma mattheei TaxID=31246 RepID=A0A183NVZ8_9TREM|nr:unnamed protein product [Schistosoma mattheei]
MHNSPHLLGFAIGNNPRRVTDRDVKSFTYLVSIFDEQGGSESDVNARTGKARSEVIQLKNMWNSEQDSANTKILMIHRDVKTVLLCGAGTRRTKNTLRQEL